MYKRKLAHVDILKQTLKLLGASVMAKQIKQLLAMLASHI